MGKGEQTRREILDAALDLVSTEGLEPVSIGKLASQVGMSKSGLFAHFKSKEELQIEMLREASARFVRKVLAPALGEPRGPKRLRAFFDNWLDWENGEFPGGCVFQAVSTELDDQPGPVRDVLVEIQSDLFRSVSTMVAAGVESGKLSSQTEPEQTAFELLSLLAGYNKLGRLLRMPDAEARVRRSFDDLIARIRA